MSSSTSQVSSSPQATSGSSSRATPGSPPDFVRLRQLQEQAEQAQHDYFEEINKLQNVPAFNGNAILAAIRQLENRFDGVEQRLDGIVGRLDVMDTRQQAAYVSYTLK